RAHPIRSYASVSAATPGSTLPSKSSKLAPPPVEMWLICAARPACSTAATESPPPTIVVEPLFVHSASELATANVPSANFGNSNTPMGPFHTTLLLELPAGLWTNVEAHPVRWDRVRIHGLRVRVGVKTVGDHDVRRQNELHAALGGFVQDLLRELHLVLLNN
uniref:Uncharacterized protein n=1 Tax=Globisporangium ultimum (strain ATCC 200006 / CBS 805.95 / DAOM BR144) TaxID=431595 RepID=K3X5U2_GLOUD